jgi:ring-1,2-phenylacetyl-CoA epoxidase subunit PaaE
MNFHKLQVETIQVETEDAKSIFFKIPTDLKEAFAYVSGQYLTIKVKVDGKEYRRAYSIPNAPDESELGITIKRVDSGVVSNYINDTLKVGDEIAVASPLGAFVYKLPDQGIQPNYLLVAAGSGITPIMSILKTVLIKEANSQLTLVYGNKTEETVIYFEALRRLSEMYPNRLKIHFVFSQLENIKSEYLFGRINNEVLQKITANFLFEQDKCFTCGPEGLINTVSEFWHVAGGNSEYIYYEKFSSSTVPVGTPKKGKDALLKVHLDEEEFNLNLMSGQTILDVMLAENIDAPYSCGIGNCSSCIAKVLEGEVDMYKCETLDEEEIKEGYILACQAHALSENVIVSFDY